MTDKIKLLQDQLNGRFPDKKIWLDVGDGWLDLVQELDRKIAAVCSTYNIEQVKEKWGGLRFYYSLPTGIDSVIQEVVRDLVSLAEIKAQNICEKCGKSPAKFREDLGWIRTLCTSCYRKYPKDRRSELNAKVGVSKELPNDKSKSDNKKVVGTTEPLR